VRAANPLLGLTVCLKKAKLFAMVQILPCLVQVASASSEVMTANHIKRIMKVFLCPVVLDGAIRRSLQVFQGSHDTRTCTHLILHPRQPDRLVDILLGLVHDSIVLHLTCLTVRAPDPLLGLMVLA